MANKAPKKVTVSKPSQTTVKYVAPDTPAPKYNAPTNNVQYVNPVQVAQYVAQEEYNSGYQPQIDAALNKVINREAFQYNPLEDASYQSLAKIYNKRGEQAAKNTMGDAAALNGGYGSSYAVTAAQQARNDYNQEFAALVPQLEQNAYERYRDNFQMDLSALGALQDADNTAYGRYRDNVSDRQWQYGMDYQKDRDAVADAEAKYMREYNAYRDSVADAQWAYGQNYNAYRDNIADSQWQANYNAQNLAEQWDNYWQGKNYNLDLYNSKKGKSSGSGSGSGGSSGSGTNTSGQSFIDAVKKTAKDKDKDTGKTTYIKKVGNTWVTVSSAQVKNGQIKGAVKGKKVNGKWQPA